MTAEKNKKKERIAKDVGQQRGEDAELDPEILPEETSSEDISVAALSKAAEEAAVAEEAERVEKLRKELDQKTREAAEAHDKYMRNYADFENYRKRMQRDLAEFKKYANEQMALELLTVLDSLGMALLHAIEGGEVNQGLVQGVELVQKQLLGVLEKFGIKPFRAKGEPFNPAMHDAMMQVESADLPENTVAQVLQEGYLYHDKVLRHAKVGVSKKPTVTPPAAEIQGKKGDDEVLEALDAEYPEE
jgi:molecular chaperone GrpE